MLRFLDWYIEGDGPSNASAAAASPKSCDSFFVIEKGRCDVYVRKPLEKRSASPAMVGREAHVHP